MRPPLCCLIACSVLAPLALVGCGGPEAAPAELDALTPWFFQRWDAEDPAEMESAVASLVAFVAGRDLEAPTDERAFLVQPFTRADVEGLVDHSFDPADTVGVGVVALSAFPIADHFAHIGLSDVTPVEPSSPDYYQRTFTDGSPECLLDRSCTTMRAHNDVERKNALYTLRYEMPKSWRWVQTPEGDAALCARSANLDEAESNVELRLLQGYSVDIWLPDPRGSVRYQVTWQETEWGNIDDEDTTGLLADGVDDVFRAQDTWLAEPR